MDFDARMKFLFMTSVVLFGCVIWKGVCTQQTSQFDISEFATNTHHFIASQVRVLSSKRNSEAAQVEICNLQVFIPEFSNKTLILRIAHGCTVHEPRKK